MKIFKGLFRRLRRKKNKIKVLFLERLKMNLLKSKRKQESEMYDSLQFKTRVICLQTANMKIQAIITK